MGSQRDAYALIDCGQGQNRTPARGRSVPCLYVAFVDARASCSVTMHRSQIEARPVLNRHRCERVPAANRGQMLAVTPRDTPHRSSSRQQQSSFHRVTTGVQAGCKTPLEGFLLTAVSRLGVLVLLLHLRRSRLSCLLLRGLIRFTLPPAAAHGPGRGAYRCSFASVPGNGTDNSAASRASSRAPRATALSLRGLRRGLLLRSLNLRARRSLRWWRVRIDAGLLVHLVVTVELITQLLIVILVVLGKDEHPDFLCCREARHGQRSACRWRTRLAGCGTWRRAMPATEDHRQNGQQHQVSAKAQTATAGGALISAGTAHGDFKHHGTPYFRAGPSESRDASEENAGEHSALFSNFVAPADERAHLQSVTWAGARGAQLRRSAIAFNGTLGLSTAGAVRACVPRSRQGGRVLSQRR